MVIIDDREVQQHNNIPELLGLPVSVTRLDAGDYAFVDRDGRPIGIERSEVNNFMQKLNSGELEEQLERCSNAFNTVILLIEGVYDSVSGYLSTYRQTDEGYWRVRIYPNTRYDRTIAVLSRLMELGIETITTPNFVCSMQAIKSIYSQRNKPEESSSLFRRTKVPHIPHKLTNNPAVPKLMALSDRLAEKTAIKLIHKFGSIWAVVHAPDEELLSVEGVGRGTVRNLKEGLGLL